MRTFRLVVGCLAMLAVVAEDDASLRGDPLPTSVLNWILDGPLRGTARLGDTLYVSGDFTRVAPSSAALGSAYAVSTTTGALLPGVFPRFDGTVSAIEPDGAGGHYVGGDYQVPGAPQRTRLARVRADGTFDPAFAPALNGAVLALSRVGASLFVAGTFTTIDAVLARGIGAVSATTGAHVAWQPALPAGFEPTALVSSPAGIVIGGRELIAPISMAGVGTYDPSSGAALWYRNTSGGVGLQSSVTTLLVAGPRVIVAHSAGVSSLDAATGVIDVGWNPQATGVTTMAVRGGTLFMAGSLHAISGQPRPGLGAVDLSTAAVLPWLPQLPFSNTVERIVATAGGSVIADAIPTGRRRRLVEIDATGAVTSWTPGAFAEVITALRLLDNGSLLVGSPLAAHGGTPRDGLAAFDLTTHALLPWAPEAAGIALGALAADDGVVFANTTFGIMAIDAATGTSVPGPALGVLSAFSHIHDGWLYASHFSVPRGPLFTWRWNLQTHSLDPTWRIAGGAVAMAGAGRRLVLATGTALTAVDADTGALLWTNAGGQARTVAISGDTVYSNQGITNLTTHDLRTGALIRSVPLGFEPTVLAIADGRVVLNGAPGPTAPLTARTLAGAPIAWNPGVTSTLIDVAPGALLASDDLLVAGGTFGRSVAPTLQGLAAFPLDGARAPSALRVRFDGPTTVLDWDPPDTAPLGGYILQGGRTPGAIEFALPLGAVTSYSVIPPTGTFYVRVLTSSVLGVETSNEVVVRGGCSGGPPPPSGLQTTIVGSQVSLTWTAPDAAVTRYDLEVGTARGLANLVTIPVGGTQTSFSAAAPPGTYVIRARAANACGSSAPSGEVVLTVGSAETLPGTPAGLMATPFSFQPRVDFTWTAPPGPVTGYVLEVGRAPGEATLGSFVLGPATTLSVTGVPPGSYVVRLRAVNAAGTGPATADIGVRMPPP